MRQMLTFAWLCCVLAVPLGPGVRAEAHEAQESKSGAHVAPRPPSNWWKVDRYRQELRLTAEQSAEIERIVQGSMPRLKADKEDLDRAQSDFRQLMEQPNAPERELLKAAERLEMARYSISKERTTMIVRIHKVLTPEQRQGLDAIAKRNDGANRR